MKDGMCRSSNSSMEFTRGQAAEISKNTTQKVFNEIK